MSQTNVALARRWFEEVWNQRNLGTVDELMRPGSPGHMEGGEVAGPNGFKQAHAALLHAFPDFRVTVEDTVAEGDHVVLRWRATATHRGPVVGLPATNERVSFRGMTWFTFADGQIVEGWDTWNQGAVFDRLRASVQGKL
ncbi:MAG: ester cyclase [Gemmatimonadales bacterium]